MKTIATRQQIYQTIDRLAEDICIHYPDEPPAVVILLEGARRFANHLLEHFPQDTPVYYLRVSSYHGGMRSSGSVSIDSDKPLELKGKQVLLVDDIYDTGRTIHAVSSYLRGFSPADIKTSVLIVKRRKHEQPVPIDFPGMTVDDLFLIGFGLDYQGRYRELDEILAVEGESDDQLANVLKKRIE
ncbi:MAG: phosphoribosyltransferase [Chitinispirillaceae bacterium]